MGSSAPPLVADKVHSDAPQPAREGGVLLQVRKPLPSPHERALHDFLGLVIADQVGNDVVQPRPRGLVEPFERVLVAIPGARDPEDPF